MPNQKEIVNTLLTSQLRELLVKIYIATETLLRFVMTNKSLVLLLTGLSSFGRIFVFRLLLAMVSSWVLNFVGHVCAT